MTRGRMRIFLFLAWLVLALPMGARSDEVKGGAQTVDPSADRPSEVPS